MNDELKQQHSAETELRKLVEDAAKLLWLEGRATEFGFIYKENNVACVFNPCDPDRGDLWKVAMAAELDVDFRLLAAYYNDGQDYEQFSRGDYQSLALAVLRAASAVWKARNGNAE